MSDMNNNALALTEAIPPAVNSAPTGLLESYRWRVQRAGIIRQIVGELKAQFMRSGIHYGKIGNSDKDTLLQPGADMILSTLHMRAEPRVLDSSIVDYGDDSRPPTLKYDVEARIIDIQTGEVLATAIGSASNRESKHAYRWVLLQDVPEFITEPERLVKRTTKVSERDFAIKKRETTGKWGKPLEYWDNFDQAIEGGTAIRKTFQPNARGNVDQGWEVVTTQYRIPNMEAADLDNTLIKMAFKRAKVSGAIFVTASGDLFTADLEDMQPEQSSYASPAPASDEAPRNEPPAEQARSAAWDGVNVDLGSDAEARTLIITLAKQQKQLTPAKVLEQLGRKGGKFDGVGFVDAMQTLALMLPNESLSGADMPFG